jgi:hypothetical protein
MARATVPKHQCAHEVVEGRVEVMNGVCGDCAKQCYTTLVRNFHDYLHELSVVRVVLFDEGVAPILLPTSDGILEITDVMAGPMDADQGAIKISGGIRE